VEIEILMIEFCRLEGKYEMNAFFPITISAQCDWKEASIVTAIIPKQSSYRLHWIKDGR